MKRLLRLFGFRDTGPQGVKRTLRGLRTGDQRELYIGLALAALTYLKKTRPGKKLIYSKTLSGDSAIVVRTTEPGRPRLKVTKPD
jgi:hypothetical protein